MREVKANGKDREGAFPAITRSVRDYAPIVASVRPYAPDALGWFDDFSHSGIYDALGAASRVGIHASAFAVANGQLSPVPPAAARRGLRGRRGAQPAQPLPGLRPSTRTRTAPTRGSRAEVDCDPNQVLPGK